MQINKPFYYTILKISFKITEKKFYFQHYSKGVKFTGAVVKPGRTYCANRTVGGFVDAVKRLNKARTIEELNSAVQSVNSYLGFLRQHDNYAIRRKWLTTLNSQIFNYVYIRGHYEVIVIRKRYRLP